MTLIARISPPCKFFFRRVPGGSDGHPTFFFWNPYNGHIKTLRKRVDDGLGLEPEPFFSQFLGTGGLFSWCQTPKKNAVSNLPKKVWYVSHLEKDYLFESSGSKSLWFPSYLTSLLPTPPLRGVCDMDFVDRSSFKSGQGHLTGSRTKAFLFWQAFPSYQQNYSSLGRKDSSSNHLSISWY